MKNNKFITETLLDYIDTIDEQVMRQFPHFSHKEIMLAQMTKLSEETGELASEVLASIGYQRPEKLKNHSKNTLEGEFADVFITALLLAKTANIDINKTLENKIAKLEKRYSTEKKK